MTTEQMDWRDDSEHPLDPDSFEARQHDGRVLDDERAGRDQPKPAAVPLTPDELARNVSMFAYDVPEEKMIQVSAGALRTLIERGDHERTQGPDDDQPMHAEEPIEWRIQRAFANGWREGLERATAAARGHWFDHS